MNSLIEKMAERGSTAIIICDDWFEKSAIIRKATNKIHRKNEAWIHKSWPDIGFIEFHYDPTDRPLDKTISIIKIINIVTSGGLDYAIMKTRGYSINFLMFTKRIEYDIKRQIITYTYPQLSNPGIIGILDIEGDN